MQIYIKDGDTLSVIALLEPSSYDPMGVYSVANSFRVVANSYGPTLQLVPLQSNPVKVSATEPKQEAIEEMSKTLPKIIELLKSESFVKTVVESGYEFNVEQILQTILDVANWQKDAKDFLNKR